MVLFSRISTFGQVRVFGELDFDPLQGSHVRVRFVGDAEGRACALLWNGLGLEIVVVLRPKRVGNQGKRVGAKGCAVAIDGSEEGSRMASTNAAKNWNKSVRA